MKTFDLLRQGSYSDIATVGIPRAFLYYRFGVLWKTFFSELGCQVVLSDETDRLIVEQGDAISVDECCLASKIYLGHVRSLMGCCDAVFVPRYNRLGKRKSFCTKFQSLPDLVKTTFEGPVFQSQLSDDAPESQLSLRVLSLDVDEYAGISEEDAFVSLGMQMGRSRKSAKRAYERARKEQDSYDSKIHQELCSDLRSRSTDSAGQEKMKILIAAHPYVIHDPYVGKPIVDMLRGMETIPLYADHFDRSRAFKRSREFSETLPWLVNRELIGTILELHDEIDGVVLVSAFPCGPDSMTNDAVMRYIKGRPILSITVDSQSGTAGLETRIESFVDILRYQKQGGYGHAER
ncbi:MAG: acyl-CoA dehydratase activase-related protein [Eggerthellales bacterium]|nr:acyl-CoA dehydratase activase-related protein [Eggerthellales bacterium]